MGKFLQNIYVYKYLESINGFNNAKEKNGMRLRLNGLYRNMLRFRNPDNGFRRYKEATDSVSTFRSSQN